MAKWKHNRSGEQTFTVGQRTAIIDQNIGVDSWYVHLWDASVQRGWARAFAHEPRSEADAKALGEAWVTNPGSVQHLEPAIIATRNDVAAWQARVEG